MEGMEDSTGLEQLVDGRTHLGVTLNKETTDGLKKALDAVTRNSPSIEEEVLAKEKEYYVSSLSTVGDSIQINFRRILDQRTSL